MAARKDLVPRSLQGLGGVILLVAVALGVYAVVSGNGAIIWFGALLGLFVITSSVVLSVEDSAGHRLRGMGALLYWPPLIGLALGIAGLVSGNLALLWVGVLLMLFELGVSFALVMRAAKERRSRMLQSLGLPSDKKAEGE